VKPEMRVVYVSSYPPRECGIATFTEDLIEAIDEYNMLAPGVVVAVNDTGATYDYDKRVRFQIERDFIESYLDAASWINNSNIDVVSLQHEFALFGGTNGGYIIAFLEKLKKPIVATLHTIPYPDSSNKREILDKIASLSDSIVVIGSNAAHILKEEYNIEDKTSIIPHGCPDVTCVNREEVKASLGLEDKIILSTFGFISSKKGIEYVINALPSIIEHDSRVVYIVIGETHPEKRKKEGEQYRNILSALVDSHGLERHVIFINRFLTKKELISYLQATDIYVVPSITRDQVSSGTLAYALAAGKAIISTPFPHAQELLSNGRGLLCEFEDSDSIAECVITLLKDNKLREEMEKRAHNHSRQFLWPEVAKKYIKLFKESAGDDANL
jgi:glycosyltransferase involved in cell wall biosynthesis